MLLPRYIYFWFSRVTEVFYRMTLTLLSDTYLLHDTQYACIYPTFSSGNITWHVTLRDSRDVVTRCPGRVHRPHPRTQRPRPGRLVGGEAGLLGPGLRCKYGLLLESWLKYFFVIKIFFPTSWCENTDTGTSHRNGKWQKQLSEEFAFSFSDLPTRL